MTNSWDWEGHEISWQLSGEHNQGSCAILFIHGFGACKEHWRYNQHVISNLTNFSCYSIDLIGFGKSSQPISQLSYEKIQSKAFQYCFDNWSRQIVDFCTKIINKPTILIGNSIGGIIALNASLKLKDQCKRVILIDCAQRTMDDKRLTEQSLIMRLLRPVLKVSVRQRFLSRNIFKTAANKDFITKILKLAYPSGKNINEELIHILYIPTQRKKASEAFRGFINLFDDHLAPDLLKNLQIPVNLIWGEKDPWEPIKEAQKWEKTFDCIKSLDVIPNAGHCPHDEMPEKVNSVILKIIQDAI